MTVQALLATVRAKDDPNALFFVMLLSTENLRENNQTRTENLNREKEKLT
jgi:hypothetical protein